MIRVLCALFVFALAGPAFGQDLLARVQRLEEASQRAPLPGSKPVLESPKALGCNCGCQEGGDCTCANCPAFAWYLVNDGSGDRVLFHGEAQAGYWSCKDGSFRRYHERTAQWGPKTFPYAQTPRPVRVSCAGGGCGG